MLGECRSYMWEVYILMRDLATVAFSCSYDHSNHMHMFYYPPGEGGQSLSLAPEQGAPAVNIWHSAECWHL